MLTTSATCFSAAVTSEMDESNSKSATMPEEAQTVNDKEGSTRRSYALVASPKGSEDSTMKKLSNLPSDQVFKLMTVAKDGPVEDFLEFWDGVDLNSAGTSRDYNIDEPLKDYAWKDCRGEEPSYESYSWKDLRGRGPLDEFYAWNNWRGREQPYEDIATTALHMAAANGQAGIVKKICSVRHIELNLRDMFDYTPLHLAANSRHANRNLVIDELMHWSHAHLVNANAAKKSKLRVLSNLTPLHLAVLAHFRDDHTYIVEKLLEWKPKKGPYDKSIIDVSSRSVWGSTPLHFVLMTTEYGGVGGLNMLGTLVQFINTNCPEAINKPDFQGRTTLHYCVESGNHTALYTLLREADKINPEAKDNQGKTPLDIAVDRGDYAMVQRLQNYLEVAGLYGYQDAYAAAANALLVVATLLATVTYTSQITLAESTLFWVFSNLSFYFAISTLLVAAGAAMPSRGSTLDNLRNAVYGASVCVAFSISCAIGAFGTAGFLSLPPGIHYDGKVVATTTFGGILCFYCLVGFVQKLAKAYSPIFLYADYGRRALVNKHVTEPLRKWTEPLTERLLYSHFVLRVRRWYLFTLKNPGEF
jgi:ankyrin repeat protein